MATTQTQPERLWRDSNFVKLWAAQTISLSGSQVSALAVPLTATITLHATATQLGIQNMLWTGGALLAALLAGPYVDRLPRRAVLIGADLGRGVFGLLVPLAALAGVLRMEVLYVVAFCFSVLSVLFDIAQASFLPTIIERERLVDGNSTLQASRSIVSVAGPSVAGAIVQVLTAPIAMVIDALSFFCSAGLQSLIRVAEPHTNHSTQRPRLWREIAAGFRLVLRDPVLRPIAASSATFVCFLQVFFALRILYLTREVGITPFTLGIIAAVGSSGSLLGVVFAGKAARRLGSGRVMIIGLLLSGLGNLLTPLAAGAFPLLVGLLMLGALLDGVGGPLYNITALSLRQTVTAPAIQGRVNATMRFLVIGATPLSALLSGLLAERIGICEVLTGAGIGMLAAFLWLLSPHVFRPAKERE